MRKSIQYQSANIAYTIRGTGQPVVMLHGFAEDSNIWNEQVEFLKEHCKLILVDLPGSGKSQMLQENDVSIEDYAEGVNALIESEKFDQCIILGHSMGGYITLAFVEAYPDKVKAFGFVHSTAFADNEDKKAARKKGIQLIEEYGSYSFLKNTTPNLFSESFKKQHSDKIAELIEQGRNFSKEALIQYYNAMIKRPDRTKVLEKSNVPVLFIIGAEDNAAPLQDLLQQVKLPKISYIHIIKNAGHMGMWEQKDELNKHLLSFIQSVE